MEVSICLTLQLCISDKQSETDTSLSLILSLPFLFVAMVTKAGVLVLGLYVFKQQQCHFTRSL